MASTLCEILLVEPTKLQYIHNLEIKNTFHKKAVIWVLKLFLKSLETVEIGYFKNLMTLIGLLWRKLCCFIYFLNYYKNKHFVTYNVNISYYIFVMDFS